jgi:hypothetical protein
MVTRSRLFRSPTPRGIHKGLRATTLSIAIPYFNEEKTLRKCFEKVIEIGDDNLILEVIIVDDLFLLAR